MPKATLLLGIKTENRQVLDELGGVFSPQILIKIKKFHAEKSVPNKQNSIFSANLMHRWRHAAFKNIIDTMRETYQSKFPEASKTLSPQRSKILLTKLVNAAAHVKWQIRFQWLALFVACVLNKHSAYYLVAFIDLPFNYAPIIFCVARIFISLEFAIPNFTINSPKIMPQGEMEGKEVSFALAHTTGNIIVSHFAIMGCVES